MILKLTSKDHQYGPLGSCKDIFYAREDEVLVSGPAGTGKSRACLEKVLFTCLSNPGVRVLVVRKTHSSLQSSALVTWRMQVAKESLAFGHATYYGGNVREAGYYFTNGSLVVTGGLDKSTKVMSTEWDMIYVQEAIELVEDDWEALTTRLRNGMLSYQQLIADTNPTAPTHWLKQRVDAGTTREIESRHEDNPVLFRDGKVTERGASYISKLDALSGVRLQRLRYGKWVAAEGIIFEEYDSAVHLLDRIPLPADTKTEVLEAPGVPNGSDPRITYVDKRGVPLSWTRYWSVDFGYTLKHPFVLQCWAESPDGTLYLYREIYRTQRTIEAHCIRIKQEVLDIHGRWKEPRPSAIVADHDAEGRAQLESHFGSITPAHKAVTEGIQAVQERLKSRLSITGESRPLLFILRGCRIDRDEELVQDHRTTCTEEEFSGYVWNDKATKEAPVKDQDDGMDAMRYVVAHKDLGGVPRIRSFDPNLPSRRQLERIKRIS